MTKWTPVQCGMKENPGCYDTGTGAMKYYEESLEYPGVERVTVRSYCGRTWENRRYYLLADGEIRDPAGPSFNTLVQAVREWRRRAAPIRGA